MKPPPAKKPRIVRFRYLDLWLRQSPLLAVRPFPTLHVLNITKSMKSLSDMNWAQFCKSLVLIILLSYFASKIISAKKKLEARKVGTLISDEEDDTIKVSCFNTMILWFVVKKLPFGYQAKYKNIIIRSILRSLYVRITKQATISWQRLTMIQHELKKPSKLDLTVY